MVNLKMGISLLHSGTMKFLLDSEAWANYRRFSVDALKIFNELLGQEKEVSEGFLCDFFRDKAEAHLIDLLADGDVELWGREMRSEYISQKPRV